MTNAKQELDTVARLLVAWLKTRESTKRSPAGELSSTLDRLPLLEPKRLREELVEATKAPIRLGYLLGPAIDSRSPILFPVLNIKAQVVDARVELCLRLIVLFREDDANALAGWRFETAEVPKKAQADPPHPYPHAQMITNLDGAASQDPREDWGDLQVIKINETRPAFPLRGSSSVGLTAGMIAALHGAPDTVRIVEDVERAVINPFRAELKDVLCRFP